MPRSPASLRRPALPPDSLGFALLEAARAVEAVLAGHNLTEALAARLAALPPQAGARGAIQDLAYGTLRDFGRGDFLLSRLLRKPLAEPAMRALLLVTLHRLDQRPEEAHTIVDQAVEAAGTLRRGALKPLANAVLRNALRQRAELAAAAEADEVARWRHPRWWIAALRRDHPDAWQEILAAGNSHPPMALRVNARRWTAAEALAALAAAGIAARALDEAALLLERPVPVARLPGFAEGRLSVQDYGAQQAARLLQAGPGERVLDACAAPGGKSAHILEQAEAGLLALDADAARLETVRANLDRLGLGAELRCADCADLSAWWDGRPFDRILADVPCSASGVARRHPDIKWLRRESDVAQFAAVQARILASLWQALAPGGRMLYATCSVFAQENQQQVAAFLARHADCLRAADGTVPERQLLPGPEHDGFYYALLEKRAESR